MIMKRLLPTSVLQSFLTHFHYYVLAENVHEIMYAHVGLNHLVAANIANAQKGNLKPKNNTKSITNDFDCVSTL